MQQCRTEGVTDRLAFSCPTLNLIQRGCRKQERQTQTPAMSCRWNLNAGLPIPFGLLWESTDRF